MKTSKFFFAFFVVLCSFNFTFAQEKVTSLKFDEFTDFPYEERNSNNPSFDSRAIRFAKEVSKNQNSKAYIIFYNQRKGQFPLNKGNQWNDRATQIITGKPYSYSNPDYQVPSERVISINGGYREYATLEFWIVPQNAEPPDTTPTFSKAETAVCPEINVAGDGFQRDRKTPLKFSVVVKGEEPNSKLELEWKVSNGKIISGQGTNQIQIDLRATNVKQITASVQIKGLNPECDNHSFRTTEVGSYPYKVDEFGFILYTDLSARFDAFMSYLNLDPTMTGYIILCGPREGSSKIVAKTIYDIRKIMAFRRFDASRIKFIEGGYREEAMTELYLEPQDVDSPKPTPTVDTKFVIFTDKIKKKKSRRQR